MVEYERKNHQVCVRAGGEREGEREREREREREVCTQQSEYNGFVYLFFFFLFRRGLN